MNQVQILLIAWVSLTVFSILLGLTAYKYRTKVHKKLTLVESFNIAIAAATIVSSCSLLYRASTSKELLDLLQFDSYVFILGAIAVIWLSIQQIWQIFK